MRKTKAMRNRSESPPGKSLAAGTLANKRSSLRHDGILSSMATEGLSDLELAKKFGTVISRIAKLRKQLEDATDVMQWFRDNEAGLLDILRSKMLVSLIDDPDRKYSVVDYAVSLDKSRLIRGEQSFSLSGLMSVVKEVEAIEVERIRLTSKTSAVPVVSPASPLGGHGGATPAPAPTTPRISSLPAMEKKDEHS